MTVQDKIRDYAAIVIPVRDEIKTLLGRLACINAVAALIDVANEVGVGGLKPLTVRAHIFNPTLSQRVGDILAPEAPTLIQRWIEESGSFRIGLGIGEASGGEWAGHLVAVGDDSNSCKKIMIDATIEQANDPIHNIVLRPVVFRVTIDHLKGQRVFQISINGCKIFYRAFPDDRFYEQTLAWQDRSQRMIIKDRILERIREKKVEAG
jgi:hypothetical protein